jgi:hypothetical protein
VTLQVVASPMIVIPTTLEVSFMLSENIYSKGIITHYDSHLLKSHFYSTGHRLDYAQIIHPDYFAGEGVLNKDTNVWLKS